MYSLKRSDLYNNNLTGTIPAEIGQLSGLDYLHLSNNSLSGSIPTEIGQLKALKYLHLDNNQLSGNVPEEILDLPSLKQADLAENFFSKFEGHVPSFWKIENYNKTLPATENDEQ